MSGSVPVPRSASGRMVALVVPIVLMVLSVGGAVVALLTGARTNSAGGSRFPNGNMPGGYATGGYQGNYNPGNLPSGFPTGGTQGSGSGFTPGSGTGNGNFSGMGQGTFSRSQVWGLSAWGVGVMALCCLVFAASLTFLIMSLRERRLIASPAPGTGPVVPAPVPAGYTAPTPAYDPPASGTYSVAIPDVPLSSSVPVAPPASGAVGTPPPTAAAPQPPVSPAQ